ncbi:addiction module protein [Geoalkalibacter subterraneus]|jgi:putative addiction module component (TIGR02574 family)|uniref:Addiction module protein n=1 Tax=Geoalkalibacter subterraneus TaxID=483547 RepID=A0A0B5FNQ4_9BACT|nr:addiction module protein [Geoalkalibacter subterraneus]AJF06279.1 addiction module protein [Geoalkalibacter subterraneus]AJF06291.1 addiction module protein [Geoalkalibacter subterraneus]
MKTEDLLREIESLPVEERARVADTVLKSLNPPESEVDKKWAEVAKRRLGEIKSGAVKPIPGEDVFSEVWKRFS